MKIFPVFFVLLYLFGCNFAPTYERAEPAIPISYRITLQEEEEITSWWDLFGDEVLSGYIQEALQNNKDLQSAMWRVCEHLGDLQVARSKLVPQITPSAGAVREKLPINEDFIGGNNAIISNFSLGILLSYEADFWGVIRNQSKEAYALYLASEENRKAAVLTLVTSVARSYVFLRQLDLQKEIVYKILQSRKDFLEIATYRFEGGLTSEIEVEQADSLYQEALAVVSYLEELVQKEENIFSVLLGKSPENIPRGKTLEELHLPRGVITGKPADLLTRRPDIRAKEQELIAANANIGVARGAFFPQISFSSLLGLDSLHLNNFIKDKSKIWGIGGSLLEELYTGGRLSGRLKTAKAHKETLAFSYQETVLQALKEVNNALVDFEKSKEIYAAKKAEVKALERYLSLAWSRYYDGLTEYLTVLDAETRVFNAKIDTARTQADQFTAIIDLYKSLGGSWVEALNSPLQPEKLFRD